MIVLEMSEETVMIVLKMSENCHDSFRDIRGTVMIFLEMSEETVMIVLKMSENVP